jgi:hypothetical protein
VNESVPTKLLSERYVNRPVLPMLTVPFAGSVCATTTNDSPSGSESLRVTKLVTGWPLTALNESSTAFGG